MKILFCFQFINSDRKTKIFIDCRTFDQFLSSKIKSRGFSAHFFSSLLKFRIEINRKPLLVCAEIRPKNV